MASIHPDTVLYVRQSWEMLEAEAPQASAHFYDHLFVADPSLIPMFRDNMSEQGDKLIQMLRFAVHEIGNAERFTKAFQALGRRHAKYGVLNAHYPLVGEALLKALAQTLGDRFTPPIRDAWAVFYETMASIMIAAAEADSQLLPPRARGSQVTA